MSKNYTGLNSTIKNRLSRLRKLGGDINSRGYTSWNEETQRNFINQLDEMIKELNPSYKPRKINTSYTPNNTQRQRTNNGNKGSRLVKQFMDKTGITDKDIAMGFVNDMNDFTKIIKNIKKLSEKDGDDFLKGFAKPLQSKMRYLFSTELSTPTNIIKNYSKNMLLANAIKESRIELEKLGDETNLIQILNKFGINEETYDEIVDKFLNKSYNQRVNINRNLAENFYNTYHDSQILFQNFDALDTLKNIIKHNGGLVYE